MNSCIWAIGQVARVGLLVIVLPGLAQAPSPPLWDKLSPGPHAVGFQTAWQLDYSRRYSVSFDDQTTYATGKAPRPILFNVWYPARQVSDSRRMPHRDYLEIRSADPLLAKFSTKLSEYHRAVIAKEVMQNPAKELTDPERRLLNQFLDTPTACVRNAPSAEGRFPLVLYHSGYGSSFEDNSVLCEFLASHGFIVIGSAFQNPDGSSFGVDGGLTSAHDMAFLVAAARQRSEVDWNHIGVIGHSGGAHAALTYALLPGATVDAVVSLDTTQDYHGLKDPGWEDMTTLVVKNRKNFTSSLLMVASPHAFFELADTLQYTRRYYFTITGMDHGDYVSQGGIWRERRAELQVGDPKETATARTEDKAALTKVKAGYRALCLYILRFLEAELKGDVAGKDYLAKQYRSTQLGGVEPHVEFVPNGRTGPDPYPADSNVPPTPRQLHRFLREQGSSKTIDILKRFRKEASDAPIYYKRFELYLVCDLLDEGKTQDAIAFRDYYRESGLDCEKFFLDFARASRRRGATWLATTYYRRLLQLQPTNREAADQLKRLNEEKNEH
jgi:pimeloyl-ACP methyl ester carboxylesterase